MRRYVYLLSPLLILLSVSYAVAETIVDVVTEPGSTDITKYAWKMLMMAITLSGSAVTPYITKYLTMGILTGIGKVKVNVPGPVLIFISTILSGVWAGVMGATTELPLNGDTATLMGGVLGGGLQKFANDKPEDVKPTPAAMKPDTKTETKK